MQQWYLCPRCNRYVQYGQPQCYFCGFQIRWQPPRLSFTDKLKSAFQILSQKTPPVQYPTPVQPPPYQQPYTQDQPPDQATSFTQPASSDQPPPSSQTPKTAQEGTSTQPDAPAQTPAPAQPSPPESPAEPVQAVPDLKPPATRQPAVYHPSLAPGKEQSSIELPAPTQMPPPVQQPPAHVQPPSYPQASGPVQTPPTGQLPPDAPDPSAARAHWYAQSPSSDQPPAYPQPSPSSTADKLKSIIGIPFGPQKPAQARQQPITQPPATDQDASDAMPRERREPKDTGTAYLYWLCLGMHYRYLNKKDTQLIFWVTLGGLGLWWLWDMVRLPDMVRDYNIDLRLEAIKEAEMLNKTEPDKGGPQQEIKMHQRTYQEKNRDTYRRPD